jgi:uncharacterized protein
MSDQKRFFIIHGWGGSPDGGWFPWLANNLRERGFFVEVPEMPDTDNPKIEDWISHLRNKVGRCDKNTFFVGHSIGCQAIMRYLEKFPEEEKSGGAVFVASWIILSNIEGQEERMISSPWINTPIDFEKVKKNMKKTVCIFSDNDPYVPPENADLFEKKLGAEIVMEKGKGHLGPEDGLTELPVVLKKLLEISKL